MLETNNQRQTPVPPTLRSVDVTTKHIYEEISLALVNSHLASIHTLSPNTYHLPKQIDEAMLTRDDLALVMAQLDYISKYDASLTARYHADLALVHCASLEPIENSKVTKKVEPLSPISFHTQTLEKVIVDPTLQAKVYSTPEAALLAEYQTTIKSRLKQIFRDGSEYMKRFIQNFQRAKPKQTPVPRPSTSQLVRPFAAFAALAAASSVAFFTMQPKSIDASTTSTILGASDEYSKKSKPATLQLRSTGDLRAHLRGSGNGSIERGLKRSLINLNSEGNSLLAGLYPDRQFSRSESLQIAGNIAHRLRQALGADIHAGARDKLVTLVDLDTGKDTARHRFAIELGGKTHEVAITLPTIDRVLEAHPTTVINYTSEQKPKDAMTGYTMVTSSPTPISIEANADVIDKKKAIENRNKEVNDALDALQAGDFARAEMLHARSTVSNEVETRTAYRSALTKHLAHLVEQQQTLPKYRKNKF